MTTLTINDQLDWDSELSAVQDGDVCRTLTLKVKGFCVAMPPGPVNFQATVNGEGGAAPRREQMAMRVSDHGPDEVRTFKDNFAACINDGFRDKLWLLHSGTRTGCYGSIPLTFGNVKCALEFWWVDRREDAQLVVQMFYDPTGPKAHYFRDNCHLGGDSLAWRRRYFSQDENPVDMQVVHDAHRERVYVKQALEGMTTFRQRTALHEFGHYLGLEHRCASEGAANSDAQYCEGGHRSAAVMSDLMALGNAIRPRHALPWIRRLAAHRYSPGNSSVTWEGSTRRPSALNPADYPRECRPSE